MPARVPDPEPGAPETPEEARKRRNRERAREWRARNPEKIRAAWRRNQAKWREDHIALRRDLDAGVDPETAQFNLEGKFNPAFNQRNNITHGASDSQRVAALAAQILGALLSNPLVDDHLRDPQYERALLAWAHAEAQVELMRAWLDASGLSEAMSEETVTEETETGVGQGTVIRRSVSRKVSSQFSELHKAEVRARNMRADLGLTPLARVRLSKDMKKAAVSLIQIWNEEDAKAIEGPQDDAS